MTGLGELKQSIDSTGEVDKNDFAKAKSLVSQMP